jgi:hypothetical protein
VSSPMRLFAKSGVLSALKMGQPLFLEGNPAIRGERTINTKTAFCQDDSVLQKNNNTVCPQVRQVDCIECTGGES